MVLELAIASWKVARSRKPDAVAAVTQTNNNSAPTIRYHQYTRRIIGALNVNSGSGR
jgi:hypothetical protein